MELLPLSRNQRGGGSLDLVKVMAMVSGGQPTLAGWVLGREVVVWRRRFFLLVGMIFCCCSSSFFVLLPEGCPTLLGRLARPWRRNRILVLFHLEGAHIAVLKAIDGEGRCRRVGSTYVSLSFQRRCEEKGEHPWLKMMTCLCLVAYCCVAGVFSQDLGMMIESSEDLRVLLVVLECSLFF
jgi:hypothetical protein